MSDHEYTPKSKFGKWFNDRLPLLTLASHLTDYPTPKNLNYWWTFGGILTFCLITQIVTGLILAMHYIAHADMAFESVEHIMRNVNFGWLIRYIHSNGASMFFLAVYIHIFRSLFYGSYKIIDLHERSNSVNLKENRYRVKKGDNLYLISKKKSVSVNDLIIANNIKSPFKIYPNQIIVLPIKKFHIVRKNETLYSISRRYGVDRFQLSKINNLRSENKIMVGQNLIIPSLKTTKKIKKKIQKNKNNISRFNDAKFSWPIKGEIISNFGIIKPGLHNDGINILSRKGKLVFASGSGKVIYTGNEIPGYGNLVLIKHIAFRIKIMGMS